VTLDVAGAGQAHQQHAFGNARAEPPVLVGMLHKIDDPLELPPGLVDTGEALVGDVSGKVAIIIDDLISAGSTIARTAQACREHGAVAVHAAVSHGVFAGAANEVLAGSSVETIVVTDTIPPWRVTAPGLRAKLVEVSAVPLFAAAIRRLHVGGSLVELRGE